MKNRYDNLEATTTSKFKNFCIGIFGATSIGIMAWALIAYILPAMTDALIEQFVIMAYADSTNFFVVGVFLVFLISVVIGTIAFSERLFHKYVYRNFKRSENNTEEDFDTVDAVIE